jgi:O-antigen/teichoic acid export membrane protein
MLDRLSPGLRRIIANVGWLFSERLLNMALTLFVGIYVLRYLGPESYGKLSYSLSFVGIFAAIAKFGLDQIVIRNIVRDEDSTQETIGTAFVLKLTASLLTIILIVGSVWSFNSDSQIRWMTLIIATTLLFDSSEIIDFWFQSKVLSKPVATVRSIQLIFSVVTKFIFIALKLPVIAFAWLMALEFIFKACGLFWIYFRSNQSIFKWRFSLAKAIELIRDSWPLVLSSLMITIYMKIDQIMLGNMAGNEAVGNYSAAVKFSEIWYFVPVGICSSVFPTIIRAKQRSKEEYYRRLQQLYDLMAWLSLAIAIPLTFFAKTFLITLLGAEYAEAGDILRLHIWAGIFVFQGVALSQWLTTENYTKVSFATTSLGALSNVFLNLYFIPLYGGIGAALATVISYGISSHISCLFYPPLFKNAWMLAKGLLIPFRVQQNLIYFKYVKNFFFKLN